MVKYYKTINNQLQYWETWDNNDNTATIHWGFVGQTGESKTIKSGLFKNHKKIVEKEIDLKIKEGYTEFDEIETSFLDVIYSVEGMGTPEDLDKRHALEGRLNELLGWSGLGHVDGGSMGSGSMEVGCVVVDFETASKVISKDLEKTDFSDYLEIKELVFKTELELSLEELIENTPLEVINLYVNEPENIDERISAVGTIYANTIGVKEASIEFVPNELPTTKEEVLSWIWSFRPDLGKEILRFEIKPEFRKLIECYDSDKMDEYWSYMNE